MNPNQPKTPARGVRIADDLWRAAQVAAAGNGETMTDVIRRALERYVKRNEAAIVKGRTRQAGEGR